MIKNEFSISCANDGTVTLSAEPFFNKMESGVTKLTFTLPDLEGFSYLLCRHDRKEWYAIPILSNEAESYIYVGQTVTSQHGRWAFNVCVCEKELINAEQRDGVIYMSDVFEGLVYDNIVDKTPAAMEPNILKLGNDFKYLYDELHAEQGIIEQDLERAEGAVAGLEAALNTARDYRDHAKTYADAAEVSAASASEEAEEAKKRSDSARRSADLAYEAENRCINSAGEALRSEQIADERATFARKCVDDAAEYAGQAYEAAQDAKVNGGANRFIYLSGDVIYFHNEDELGRFNISDIDELYRSISELRQNVINSESTVRRLSNKVDELEDMVGNANSTLSLLI